MNNKDNQQKKIKHKVKIIILGNVSGKTQILNRIIENKYSGQCGRTSIDFRSINVFLADRSTLRLQLWDTHSQERIRHLIEQYFQGITVALFVYDITNQNSFMAIQEHWQPKLRESIKDDTLKILLGNKIDVRQDRIVNQQMVIKYAKQKRIDYFEVSAKTGENIQEMLAKIVAKIEKKILFGIQYSKQKLELQIKTSEEKKLHINNSNSLENLNSQTILKVNQIILNKYIAFIRQSYIKE